MSRPALLVALIGVIAAACGEPVEVGETAGSSTSAPLPSTITTPPTTTSDVPVEVIELLDQLDAAWTPECDEAATEVARLRVRMVVEWAPSYEQALGSFGGTIDDKVEDIATFLERGCPEAGSVIRFIDVVDDEFPRGDVNAALALSPMLELSLQHLGWVIGIPMAERLAPQRADDAPDTPEWDPTAAASCDEFGAELRDYYLTYIESLNNISPLQAYDWDATTVGEESLSEAAVSPLASLAESECDTATALHTALEGAADADAISFVAETARWGLVSNIRDYLFNEVASGTSLTLSPVCEEGSTHRFTITNNGTTEASEVTIEVTGTEESSEGTGTNFSWSQDSIAPGETVTVESTISRDQPFESLMSWIDDNGVTHSQNVGLGCFSEIGTIDPDS